MPPTIEEVKTRHEARLLAMRGVVSVGVGRNPDGQLVLVIGLDRPRRQTLAKLPPNLEGYLVRVEIIGQIKAQ